MKSAQNVVYLPETGLEEINGDLLEADFWPLWLASVQLPDCPLSAQNNYQVGCHPQGDLRVETVLTDRSTPVNGQPLKRKYGGTNRLQLWAAAPDSLGFCRPALGESRPALRRPSMI